MNCWFDYRIKSEGIDELDRKLAAEEKKLQAYEDRWNKAGESIHKQFQTVDKDLDSLDKKLDGFDKSQSKRSKNWIDSLGKVTDGTKKWGDETATSSKKSNDNLDSVLKTMGKVEDKATSLSKTKVTVKTELQGQDAVIAGLEAVQQQADALERGTVTVSVRVEGNEQAVAQLLEVQDVETTLDGDTATVTVNVDSADGIAKLEEVKRVVSEVDGNDVNVNVNVDAAAATAELEAFEVIRDHVDGNDVNIDVNVHGAAEAATEVTAAGAAADAASSAFSALGGILGPIPLQWVAIAGAVVAATAAVTPLLGGIAALGAAFTGAAAGAGLLVGAGIQLAQGLSKVNKAQDAVTKATDKQKAAQEQLNEAYAEGDPTKIADAQKQLETATDGVTKAQAGLQSVLDQQSSAVQSLWSSWQNLKQTFLDDSGFKQASESLARIGSQALDLASQAIPALGQAAVTVGQRMETAFQAFFDTLQQSDELANFNALLDASAQILADLTTAAGDFVLALVNIFAIAIPQGKDLAATIKDLAAQFLEWTRSAEGIQQIKDAVAGAVPVFQALWDAVVKLSAAILEVGVRHADDVAGFFRLLGTILTGVVKGFDALLTVVDALGPALSAVLALGVVAFFKGWSLALPGIIEGLAGAAVGLRALIPAAAEALAALAPLIALAIVIDVALYWDPQAATDAYNQAIDSGETTGNAWADYFTAGLKDVPIVGPITTWIDDNIAKPIRDKFGVGGEYDGYIPKKIGEWFSSAQSIAADVTSWLETNVGQAIRDFDPAQLGHDLGVKIAEALKAAIPNIDWEGVGTAILTAIAASLDPAAAVGQLVQKIYDSLSTETTSQDWSPIGNIILDGLLIALDPAAAVGRLVQSIYDDLSSAMSGMDWATIGNAILDALLVALDPAAAVGRLVGKVYDSISSAVGSQDWASIGLSIVEGIFSVNPQGIVNKFTAGLVQGIEDGLGVASPSTVMMSIGADIVNGIWEGIQSVQLDMPTWLDENIVQPAKDAWDTVNSDADSGWTTISDTISGWWDDIKSTSSDNEDTTQSDASTTWDDMDSDADSGWSTIKDTISGWWDDIVSTSSDNEETTQSDASTTWGDMDSDADTGWSTIWDTIKGWWQSIVDGSSEQEDQTQSDASTTWGDMDSDAETGWGAIKSTIVRIAGAIKDEVLSVWESLKTRAQTIWDGIAAGAKSAMERAQTALVIKSIVPDMVDQIIAEFERLQEGTAEQLDGTSQDLIDKFTQLKQDSTQLTQEQIQQIVDEWNKLPDETRQTLQNVGATIADEFGLIQAEDYSIVPPSFYDQTYNSLVNPVTDATNQIQSTITSGFNQAAQGVGTAVKGMGGTIEQFLGGLLTDIARVLNALPGLESIGSQVSGLGSSLLGTQGALGPARQGTRGRAEGGVDKPEPQPSTGGVSSGLAPRVVYGEQPERVKEAYIVEGRGDNLPYLEEAASWFGMGLVPDPEMMARGGVRRHKRHHPHPGASPSRRRHLKRKAQARRRKHGRGHGRGHRGGHGGGRRGGGGRGAFGGGSAGNAGLSSGSGGSSGNSGEDSQQTTPSPQMGAQGQMGTDSGSGVPTAGDQSQCGVFPSSTPVDSGQQPFTDAALQQFQMTPHPASPDTGFDHVNVPNAAQLGGDLCGTANGSGSVPSLGDSPTLTQGDPQSSPSSMPACGPSGGSGISGGGGASGQPRAMATAGGTSATAFQTGGINPADGAGGASSQVSPVDWTQVPIGWWDQFLGQQWLGKPSEDWYTLFPPSGYDPSSNYTAAPPSQGMLRGGILFFQGGGLNQAQLEAGKAAGESVLGAPYSYGEAGEGETGGFDCAGIWNYIESAILDGSPSTGKRWGTYDADAGGTSFSTSGNVPGGANIGVELSGGGGYDDTHMAGDIGGESFEATIGAGVSNGADASGFPDQWTMGAPADMAQQIGDGSGGPPAQGGGSSFDPSQNMSDLVSGAWDCAPDQTGLPTTPPAAVQPWVGDLPGISEQFLQDVGQQQIGALGSGDIIPGDAATGGNSVRDWLIAGMEAAGLDPVQSDIDLLEGLVGQESGGDPNATNSESGAMGLLQLMPDTWDAYNVGGDPYDPVSNVAASIRYMMAKYGGIVGFSPYASGGLALTPHLGAVGESGSELMLPLENKKAQAHVQATLGIEPMVGVLSDKLDRLTERVDHQTDVVPQATGQYVAQGTASNLARDPGTREAAIRGMDREALRLRISGATHR